ncbi:M35 family metallo-endopeptidase [Thalassotalea ganghwensis]
MAFNWTNSSWTHSRLMTTQGAAERITRMLTRAYLSVKAVQRDEEARGSYIEHFNDAGLTQLAHVQRIIRSMHDRIVTEQVIQMHYVPDELAFSALSIGPLPDGVALSNVEAFVIARGVEPAEPLDIFIAPAFFTGNVYIPNAINQRTGTGTILHELSHGVGGTVDHAYTWQPQYSELTEMQRANNADTYRAYCQSFDA